MNVTLLHYTPLEISMRAIRACWQSQDRSDMGGPADRNLMHKVGNVNKHSSTLEHVYYNFELDGISRACLQELARHRIASMSVKSTRYTLKELKEALTFKNLPADDVESVISEYVVLTGNTMVDAAIMDAVSRVQELIQAGIPNDIAKYALPEAYKTMLVWSINMRSLQNFLTLRTSTAALWEIRELAHSVYEALPETHQFMFEDFVNK